MRTTKMRKSVSRMVAAELTVAAHLLLFLPPPVQAAVSVRIGLTEKAGEAALAPFKIERAVPVVQESVDANKTVPDVEPPAQYPTFSPIPTDAELIKARVFGEPLVPEAGETNPAENKALAQAIISYLYGGDSEALEPLEGVVTNFPRSRWRVAVQANVGSWYRRKNYFTRAQRNLTEAWRLGKSSGTEGVRRLAEFAAGELMLIHMQFGHVDPLEALVTEFEGRELTGGITEKLYAAQATVWGLRNDHEKAIPSGSVALEHIRKEKHEKAEKQKTDSDPKYKKNDFKRNAVLDAFPADHEGASLAEIQDLADLTDLKLQMAKREIPSAAIPVPSVVHFKQGHFAALVEARGERFRFDDPFLGGEAWLSREALEEEISGFFLVEHGRLPDGWRLGNRNEMGPIRGKCLYATPFDGSTRTSDLQTCDEACGLQPGMAKYTFHTGLASLNLFDNPVGYSTPSGPAVRFKVLYNQREANQPTTFSYSNLGTRWVHNWLSYVEDDPTAVGDPVELYVRGGGRETYDGFVNGVSAPQQDARSVLAIISSNPIQYERELPDGTKQVYGQPDGASSAPRRVFLTEWSDPQGNQLIFTYDSNLRLVSVTDAIGQVTTLSYELLNDPLKITKVADPFGRAAIFEYDDSGRLIRITDALGLSSTFQYGTNGVTTDFIRALTTPYGTTTFRHGTGPYNTSTNRWIQATDPLGGTERVEQLLTNAPVSATDADAVVPIGFTGNSNLDTHVSVFYSKLMMERAATDPPNPSDGTIIRWRSSSTYKLSGYQIQSTKFPLENRTWYEHIGETLSNGVGSDGRPSMVGRVLDDGASQIYRYEYNKRGRIARYIDPIGRETLYEYASNDLDRVRTKQKKGAAHDLVAEFTYNAFRQPLTTTDAAGQTTTYTYTSNGQIESTTSPPRDGVEERTTTYYYDQNGLTEDVIGPVSDATMSYTYDAYGRTKTITDSSNYTLTFDYDHLDRRTRVTYPDGTFAEIAYERLDPIRFQDRFGRRTHFIYDALGRLSTTIDPGGRSVSRIWCACGVLDALVDPNGNRTNWERDLQGRIIKEIRVNDSEWLYEYEKATSRLKAATDPKGQVKTYAYYLDNNVQSITYTNEEHSTPNVSFTYDISFNRVSTMTDGTGTTSYEYHPIRETPALGAGRLASVDGPLVDDTTTYAYDELGRVLRRATNGVPVTYKYGTLDRMTMENSSLGTFTFQYDGVSDRLRMVTYPNGQTSTYTYDPNSGDHRLKEMHHRQPDGVTLSKFNYGYDATGNLTSWTQQQETNPSKVYDFEYDSVDELRGGVWRTSDTTPTILKRYRYNYDSTGNRTVEQIDDAPVLSAYDSMNRISSQTPGGTLRFAGTLDEAAIVSIQSTPAAVTSNNLFSGDVSVSSGTSQVVVIARDYTGNERTNTYEVDVSGTTNTFTFDANGNMTGDGNRTLEWDAENRIVATSSGSLRSEFSYDGKGRLTNVVEKDGGVVTLQYKFLWCGSRICEQRDSEGEITTKRFFSWGVQDGGNTYYTTTDHLGSIRELTDSAGNVRARYSYGPFGRTTKVSGDLESPFGFSRYYAHAPSGLYLTLHRPYDPALGRWLSPDPLANAQTKEGPNLYQYVANNPVMYKDNLGLEKVQFQVITTIMEPDPAPGNKSEHRIDVDTDTGVIDRATEFKEIGTSWGVPGFGNIWADSARHGNSIQARMNGHLTTGMSMFLNGIFPGASFFWPDIDYYLRFCYDPDRDVGRLLGIHDGYPSYSVSKGGTEVYFHRQGTLNELYGLGDVVVDEVF